MLLHADWFGWGLLAAVRRWAGLLVVLALAACARPRPVPTGPFRLRAGDNPAWAAPAYPDRDWALTNGTRRRTVAWVRCPVQLPPAAGLTRPLGVAVLALGSFEAYWDGHLLGRGGVVGTSAAREVPGPFTSYLLLPDSLAGPGRHLLALRTSNWHGHAPISTYFAYVDTYFALVRQPLLVTGWVHVLAGAYLLAACYYGFLFWLDRREWSRLLFSGICLLFSGLLGLEYLKSYVLYAYPFQNTRLEVIGGLTGALAWLVPVFFSLHFPFARRRLLWAGLPLALASIYLRHAGHYDRTAELLGGTMWLAALLVVGLAVHRGAPGSRPVLGALLLSGLVAYAVPYDFSLFLGFTLVALGMLYVLGQRTRTLELAYTATQLRAARLEIDLLRKSIQPHYLLNTLTSLIDWVEESPPQGVRFIQALAREFSLLSRVADAALIPIEQEVALCRSHLTLMAFRQEVRYEWADTGLDPAEQLPPALLLTAVENGVTHCAPLPAGYVGFRLAYTRTATHRQYELLTLGVPRPANAGQGQGTGLRYMEARLREGYGTRWALHSAAAPEGWRTTIRLPAS